MTSTSYPLLKSHRFWRFLEILPGALSLTALLLPIVFSIYRPTWVAIFIMVYATFWLFRSIFLSLNLYRGYQKTREAIATDWMEKLKNLYPVRRDGKFSVSTWHDIYHSIILLTCKEDLDVLRSSINSYLKSTYPKDKMVLILAGETSDQENFLKIADRLQKEYGHCFYKFMITVHPANLPGEIKGKSANATYAAKQLKIWLDQEKIPYSEVLLSNFDADTATHPQYFAELTYKYLTAENRTRHAYQPMHFYHNNIWEVPIPIRLIALSCSFWRMAESVNIKRFKSFSSRSNSFQTIVDVDFWDPGVIPEDSRQYWTAYFTYDGHHTLIPIYCPLYMDAVQSSTVVKTFQNQYLQLRRWAWGVCDFPFVVLNFLYHKNISLRKKLYHIFFLLEGHFFWATAPLLLTFTGWLPGVLNKEFTKTTLAYTVPEVTSNLLSLASVGILTFLVLSFLLLPPPPPQKTFLAKTSLIFQWFLVPFVSIFLSAFPALEAQTRLMLGKRLEYKVTEKIRTPNQNNVVETLQCNVSTFPAPSKR